MTQYQPRPGDIGLTQISGWGGKAIRLGQWFNGEGFADYQHAFVFIGRLDGLVGDDWIVEAMPEGARMVQNWHDARRARWLICPDEYREAVAASARGFMGVPYSVADYFALAAHRLHIPAPHLKKFITQQHSMICSQLVDAAAMEGNWHLFSDDRWPGYVTPLSLNKLWLTLGPGGHA